MQLAEHGYEVMDTLLTSSCPPYVLLQEFARSIPMFDQHTNSIAILQCKALKAQFKNVFYSYYLFCRLLCLHFLLGPEKAQVVHLCILSTNWHSIIRFAFHHVAFYLILQF